MNKEKLVEAGIDYDEGVDRFGGRPELYEKYLKKFFDSGFMSQIERELEAKDMSAAFRITHDLKGASGNLSLNRFYSALCVLTEKLRDGKADTDYMETFSQVKAWYEKAANALEEAEQ